VGDGEEWGVEEGKAQVQIALYERPLVYCYKIGEVPCFVRE